MTYTPKTIKECSSLLAWMDEKEKNEKQAAEEAYYVMMAQTSQQEPPIKSCLYHESKNEENMDKST